MQTQQSYSSSKPTLQAVKHINFHTLSYLTLLCHSPNNSQHLFNVSCSHKQLPECVTCRCTWSHCEQVQYNTRAFISQSCQPNETKRFGEEQLFTVDACMLFVRLTHHQYLRLSSCCCFLEISKTGRTLSSAEHGEREASGLPGQRTGRDI